jgi:hypothetical protein
VAPVATDVVVQMAVLDSSRKPIPSQLVNFAISDGGSLYAAAAISNPDGTVFARWTLGTKAGVQWIEARNVDQETGAAILLGRIEAKALAGSAATVLYATDGIFFLGERRALSDVFGVVDKYGNPVSMDASTIGIAGPWKSDGQFVTAPSDLTASANVWITVASRVVPVRIFSAPDLQQARYRITGSCLGVSADSLTFDAPIASPTYTPDRRSLTFSAPYVTTKWSKGTASSTGIAFPFTASASIAPDSIQTRGAMGTFVLTSTTPVTYQSKATAPFLTQCRSNPVWVLRADD